MTNENEAQNINRPVEIGSRIKLEAVASVLCGFFIATPQTERDILKGLKE